MNDAPSATIPSPSNRVERCRHWACDELSVPVNSPTTEVRRLLYQQLADDDFMPGSMWSELAPIAAQAKPAAPFDSTQDQPGWLPHEFLDVDENNLIEFARELLKDILDVDLEEQQRRLAALHKALTPLAHRRLDAVLDVVRALQVENSPCHNESEKQLIDDVFSIVLAPPTKRSELRDHLANLRVLRRSHRRAAARLQAKWPEIAALDQRYFDGVIGQLPSSSNERQGSSFRDIVYIYWPAVVVIALVLVISFLLPRKNVNKHGLEETSSYKVLAHPDPRGVARNLENEPLSQLKDSPPAPHYVLPLIPHLSAARCQALLDVYEELHRNSNSHQSPDTDMQQAMQALRERIQSATSQSTATGESTVETVETPAPTESERIVISIGTVDGRSGFRRIFIARPGTGLSLFVATTPQKLEDYVVTLSPELLRRLAQQLEVHREKRPDVAEEAAPMLSVLWHRLAEFDPPPLPTERNEPAAS